MNLKTAALILCIFLFNYHVISLEKVELNGPSERFDNMHILVEPDIYVFYWSVNETDALFEVHVKGKNISFKNKR
jgi:hypothetical protein